MALPNTAISKTKPTGKQRKLFDSRGLYLLIAPTGGKLWRLKDRVAQRVKPLAG